MNSDLIIFIDGYLSTIDRARVCSELIDQIKSTLPYKVALFNKYSFSWGLDTKVDYYFNHLDGFMIGQPPQELLDKELYERPYVYVKTGIGTHENWLPLVGVQDHAANIYNSFIFASEAAKNLGFKRIFRIEADTKFDINELKSLISDLNSFEDYLIYGERQEGDWAKPHHRIMDLHIIGFSVNLFQGFNILYNDKDFWKLCEKINYYGKWIEYIIPTSIYYQHQRFQLKGINHPGSVRDRYPNTQFDLINNPGGWTDKWNNIPKPCRILNHKDDKTHIHNKLGLFYWNEESSPLEVKSEIKNSNGEIIYSKQVNVNPYTWLYDEVELQGEEILTNINTRNGIPQEFVIILTPESILELNTRFIKQ
jgi:hypothetical protein